MGDLEGSGSRFGSQSRSSDGPAEGIEASLAWNGVMVKTSFGNGDGVPTICVEAAAVFCCSLVCSFSCRSSFIFLTGGSKRGKSSAGFLWGCLLPKLHRSSNRFCDRLVPAVVGDAIESSPGAPAPGETFRAAAFEGLCVPGLGKT